MCTSDKIPNEPQLTEDEAQVLYDLGLHGESLRRFLGRISAASLSVLFAPSLGSEIFGKSTPDEVVAEIQGSLQN
ncbi:hypothetical protein [Pareuzebyella sediminis]|uniref:hypothetical protein n=1 Tax=Pareuzebyella sediminis TaxID=2607998 RepID=UPI0011EC9AAF|nr:hypothetical protein [Pareuzebyella sediminis]